MSNLGEQAMEILDELHTERLAYGNEYVPLADAANLLTAYEQTGMDPEAIERMVDAYGRGLTLREDAAERLELMRGISTARLRELAEADKDGRCVVLPKDGMLYFLEESIDSGEKWVGNWPVKDVFFKCGFGIASLSYSIQDIGSKIYLTREAAEAALKGEQDG